MGAHTFINMFKFVVLLSSSALAETCLQCSSIMSDKDQTKDATIVPSVDFGDAGLNCFQPIGESGLPTALETMKKQCSGTNGGCYSIAYSIKRAKPVGSSFDRVVDHYIERGCQSDLPKWLREKVSKETWTDQPLNEGNYGIHGTITAKVSSRPATQTGAELKKLNWPTTDNGGAVTPGQPVTYLTCYKENRMDMSKTKQTFRPPTKKVTCGLHENRCFSSVAHVKKNSDTYIQYAHRGCLNANSTILGGQQEKPYYTRHKLPAPYADLNVTHTIHICKTAECNRFTQPATGSEKIFTSSIFLTLLMLLLN